LEIAEEANDNKIPKIKAQKNPWIWIPERNLSASITIKTLMIKRKIPKVRIVIGNVRRMRIGFIIAFKMPKTITKINAVE
jgi:hypothetical protein